ncbi:group III truncated hemoglobin [Marinobacteraceae bacterium S3BR75-40.1]
MAEHKPDLDTPEAIHELVQAFYERLLDDPVMRPVFLETAGVDLEQHLPTIEAYWRKMLLGERGVYRRHMVQKHEGVHDIEPLRPEHFRRWGDYFHQVIDERFEGPYAERAHHVAERVLANLEDWLLRRRVSGG